MARRESIEQAVLDAVATRGEATVEQVATAAGIGKTSARKHLARLLEAGSVTRHEGGREGRRRLPDRYSCVAEAEERQAPSRPDSEGGGEGGRLRPGQLDGLVLSFLAERAAEGPFGPSAVAKALARSNGATANALARLAEAGNVRQVSERPRRYEIGEGKR